ncbi:class I SAM-dependent methyltransferase [Candidatus Tisiphia endosymbiont of Sialis lutaria]|uniref:class I SAM-dependent methyltransferase n=1 Tax=Candidatus Tisiphia endosymbiont of Sialis lutaria TaxID=2029164 RepID=UPI00312C8E5F
MKKSQLGLPLEYKKLPEYFDAHNINDDTDKINGVIENLLRERNVQTVLDLTCGTGSQVFFLAKRGYKITGADFSPALLKIARERAYNEKVDVKFIDGDMRTLKVGAFDAVITIFNAVGHLTKVGFEKAMRNIYQNLNNNGIYIFDIFNLDAMTDSTVIDMAMQFQKKVSNTKIYSTQCSIIDRENSYLTSYDTHMIQKNADKPKRFYNKFSLQIYTAKELQEMLTINGFETIDQYGIDGSEFLKDRTINILTVAKKK